MKTSLIALSLSVPQIQRYSLSWHCKSDVISLSMRWGYVNSAPIYCHVLSDVNTAASHYNGDAWALRHWESPSSRQFIQQLVQTDSEKNIDGPHYWPLGGEQLMPVDSPHIWPVMQKAFLCLNITIMSALTPGEARTVATTAPTSLFSDVSAWYVEDVKTSSPSSRSTCTLTTAVAVWDGVPASDAFTRRRYSRWSVNITERSKLITPSVGWM